MNEKIAVILSIIGGIAGWLFGGLDELLNIFITVLVVDTVTGMVKNYYFGTYASSLFRRGLIKKSGYMLAVILAVCLDRMTGQTGVLRSSLLVLFVTNEATSIVENLGEMGVPIPERVKNAIAILKKKNKDSDEEEAKDDCQK